VVVFRKAVPVRFGSRIAPAGVAFCLCTQMLVNRLIEDLFRRRAPAAERASSSRGNRTSWHGWRWARSR